MVCFLHVLIASATSSEHSRAQQKVFTDFHEPDLAHFVQLHVRLQDAVARRLLVDRHVCEIQLILIDFARIKVMCPSQCVCSLSEVLIMIQHSIHHLPVLLLGDLIKIFANMMRVAHVPINC